MAVGLLASVSRGLAVTMTWTNGSDVWTSPTAWTTNQSTAYTNEIIGVVTNQVTNSLCVAVLPPNSIVVTNCVGGTGGSPSSGDSARFTNNTSYTVTVNVTTNLSVMTFTNTAGVVTLNAGLSTLTVTGRFRVADGGATSTVVWAGGTLSVANGSLATTEIGSANTNSVGILMVTNGTAIMERSVLIGGNVGVGAVGKLVISGPGVVTNSPGMSAASAFIFRPRSPGSELIITNGGKLFWAGEARADSNGFILVSGPNSFLYCTNILGATSTFAVGTTTGPGSRLIVSNGGTIFSDGTISIGRNSSSFNTGVVVGAGSKLISSVNGNFTVGVGSAGASDNYLTVYDGGFVNCQGPFFSVPGGTVTNASFFMGGTGAMSTGMAIAVRVNSQALNSLIVVTNAVFTCSQMQILGVGSNNLTVLSKGTLIFSNQYAASATLTNVLSINGTSSALTIDGGTINAVSGTNALGVIIGSGSLTTGNSLTIINGGKLLTEAGSIGGNSSFSTGVVSGVGSVWSNFTAGVSNFNSNDIVVGAGSSASGSLNYLAVQNGASLFNNGSLDIGNSGSSTLNSVLFGGPGASAVINITGMLNIGGGSGTSGNSLTVSNASVSCDTLNVGGNGTNRVNNTLFIKGGMISANAVRVRLSNTVVFTVGTLSAGGMDTDPGANNSNVFVVGDGTSAAFYDMAAGGTGYHGFSNGGLVVTNGASLRGNGTLTGTMTVLGTFAPGFTNSVGSIFSSNSLSFGSSAALNYDLGTSSDSVTVNSNLKLGGTLNVTDAGGFGTGNYTLFTYAGSLNSGTLTVGATPNGSLTYTINTNTTGTVILQVTGGSDPFTTWQTQYFTGSPLSPAPGADPLGKGISNTNQFLAGFNPTNAAAYVHITTISKTNSSTDIRVDYLGASGDSTYTGGPTSRTNVLEFTAGTAGSYNSNNFASTGVTNILSGGVGLGTLTNMVDSGGATNVPARYYRVRVLVP